MRGRTARGIVLVIGVGIGGLWLWWSAPTAHADAYPYAAMPCIWAPYAATGATAQWCTDYDWGYRPNDLSAVNVISPYGYYYRNCTDYVAWKLDALRVSPALYKGLGNAKDWAAKASAKGVRVDGVPAVGAVAVRTSGTYGHTAFIEAIDASGKLTVSQYNYRADGNYSKQTGTPTEFGFVAFIHFEETVVRVAAVVTPPLPPPAALATPELVPEAAASAIAAPVAIEEEPPEVDVAALSENSQVATLAAATETIVQSESSPPAEETAEVSEPVLAESSTSPPAQIVWQQATNSPPVAAAPTITRTSAHTTMPSTSGLDLWPLVGLAGAVLAREAPRRFRT